MAKAKVEKGKIRELNWFEKFLLEHADPLNAVMHVFAIIAIALGLWFRDWNAIIGGIVIALVGHLQLRIRARIKKKK